MIVQKIKGANANPGAPANWNESRDGICGTLPIRLELDGERIRHCESAWRPSEDELKLLNNGGAVVLRVCGWQVPVALYVVPEGEAERVEQCPI